MISGLGGGFVDRRPGLMVCVCGSVDGLCLCVWLCCGWVVAEMAGSSGFPMGFIFLFFIIWVFVPVGFW